MFKEQMIEDITTIQYFIKTVVYDEFTDNKIEYIKKIKNTYKDISIDEVEESLEEIKYLAVNTMKLSIRKKIETNYYTEKAKAYEEYLDKCKNLELGMKDNLMKSKEIKDLTVDSVISYINCYV